MNIAEASYRVGQALKKIDEGKEMLDLLKVIQDKTSPEAWHNFFKLVITNARNGLGHYYGIANAYYLLEANKEDQMSVVIKKEIEEILSIPEYKKLVELGIYFGNAIEELNKEIITPATPKNFAGTVAKPKLKRKIQDLHVSVQRTSIVKYIFTNLATNQKSMDIFSKYDLKRSSYPFTKENRILIQRLSKNNEELNLLYSSELFSTVIDYMKRLIFETHLGIIIELDESDITSKEVKTIDKFDVIRIKCTNPLLLNEGFTFKIVEPGVERFGLFTNKRFSFSQENWNCKLSGYIYPQDDKGLFDL